MTHVFNRFQTKPSQEHQCENTELKLLIVEDVLTDVELMILALETAKIQFVYDAVDSLKDCEQLLKTKSYDAVLTDYRLPQFTAYQVLNILQQSTPEIPLILITGSLGEEAAVECIKAGMTDYVLKDRLFRLPMVLKRSLQEFALRRQQQASIAQIRQQAQHQAIVNHIVQAMRETLILDEVLLSTVDALHQALKPSRCFISQPDFQNELWVNHVSTATIDRENCVGVKCFIYPHYQEAFQRGEIIVISRTDTNIPLALKELVINWELNAILIAPLLYQQTLLGGIILHQCDRDRIWTKDEISLVKAISDQCAIAIHQAQLFHQVQQQTQWERTLNQISRSLNSSLNPGYILQEIVRLTGESFNVDRVMIYALEAEQIRVTREWRNSHEVTSLLDAVFPLAEWKELVNFSPYEVFYSENLHQIAVEKIESIKKLPHLTVLSVPIFVRDEYFGGLTLHTTTRVQNFTAEEINLLQGIADKAAIALYNAQSYEILEKLVKQRTHELEAEKRLSDAANRAKSEFLSNMSHELRTPLTGILGFSSILVEQIFGPLNSKQKQYVEGIHTCGKHLLALINDLLDLTKIEAGKEELVLEAANVKEICQESLILFEEKKHSSGLHLNFAIASNINTCVADQRRLKQVLVNLLSNAFKFTDSGSVTLKVEQSDTTVSFAVIDTGIGITPEEQTALFQPFNQLDSGLNRKYEGTGLGLALSRKIARLHGGDITVYSQPGYGSCFTLVLPNVPKVKTHI